MKAALEKSTLVYAGRPFNKRYRSSFEIIAVILEGAVKEVTRCDIATHLNTNYTQLQKYLSHLIKIGLIEVKVDEKKILYKTSEKGLEFLRLYYTLLKMLWEKSETLAHAKVVYGCFSLSTKAKGRGRRSFGL
ncbi:MAG: winged helix-turn-helix domain-containing protein [Candidatus Bathyarchaeia archaeon]